MRKNKDKNSISKNHIFKACHPEPLRLRSGQAPAKDPNETKGFFAEFILSEVEGLRMTPSGSRVFRGALLIFIFYFLFLSSALSQQPPASPHAKDAAQTGIISGVLLKDGKTPLANYHVRLEIFEGHDLILQIPKLTDSKGAYQFKNIFQTPEFSYSISTEYEKIIYRTDFVSLKHGENLRTLNLAVGQGAKEAPPLPVPIAEEAQAAGPEVEQAHKDVSAGEYKLIAAMLSLGAVVYAVYKLRKKRGK